MFFPYTCHLLPTSTSQGEELGQEGVAAPEGLLEVVLKSLREAEGSTVQKHNIVRGPEL